MNPARRQRLLLIALLLLLVGGAVGLALTALQQNINLFYSPTEVRAGVASDGESFRLGGIVVEGSVVRGAEEFVRFVLTDTANEVTVHYNGFLPDLFREGQGIVANGAMQNDTFIATQVLAKHDETYMPPSVQNAVQAAQARKVYGDADGDGKTVADDNANDDTVGVQ